MEKKEFIPIEERLTIDLIQALLKGTRVELAREIYDKKKGYIGKQLIVLHPPQEGQFLTNEEIRQIRATANRECVDALVDILKKNKNK